MNASEAWLDNPKWAGNRILSNAKSSALFLAGFTLIWLGANFLLFLNREEILSKFEKEPFVAVVLLFPLSGVWLIVLTCKAITQWLKIGKTPLTLDPFPGSIGGQIGGYIDTNIGHDLDFVSKVTLRCVYSYMTGSGDNRKRSESIKWQKEGVCHNLHGEKGMRFQFRFDVPDDLSETDVEKGSSYHLWRLQVEGESKGIKLNRQYEIPVFKTGQNSAGIHTGTEDHQGTIDAALDGVESIARMTQLPDGIEAWFPPFQRPLQGIAMCLFGLFFVGIGIGLNYADTWLIFTIVFTLVGGLILLAGGHYLGKALLVSVTSTEIKTRRFMLGIPISTKTIAANDFAGFERKNVGTMQSGNKTTVYYRVFAKSISSKNLVVAERLTSQAEADVLIERFENWIEG